MPILMNEGIQEPCHSRLQSTTPALCRCVFQEVWKRPRISGLRLHSGHRRLINPLSIRPPDGQTVTTPSSAMGRLSTR
ncbi:hypothetical protein FR483_n365R [Paramecium bursaria Chlorella virus FR483]|nr:hypothetical protein FR483_n365R [Paramecium bursaria Chlorella virus FR483]ABT15650.1 hypothetical protein FR483_n365R [Paramecium bursaria Chlorella virus FR483]